MPALAFVFPGQGSQFVGMLDAWGAHPVLRQTLAEAAEALHEDIGSIIRDGPRERLDQTASTQPAMLIAGVACYRIWRAEGGPQPTAMAGHSLGEYSALVAAGALRFADALPLVRLRAQAMQQAVPLGSGTMAAILGLEASVVRTACAHVAASTREVVEAANYNDPRQTVIAGSAAGVDAACEVLKAAGAKRTLLLQVSAPFHSSLMQPASVMLREHLRDVPLTTPAVPVVNNVDVAVQTDADAIRDALVRQAYGPVRWVEVVQALRARGAMHIVECGPGKVLSNLVKRIDADVVTGSLADPASLQLALQALQSMPLPAP